MKVRASVLAAIVDGARLTHPHEACGLLLGTADVIDRVQTANNVATDPARHFEIDPASLIAAHKTARAGGAQIVGYWHSHPSGPAEPSATDRAQAAGDGKVWAIVAGETIGWWRDTAEGFAALSTAVVDG